MSTDFTFNQIKNSLVLVNKDRQRKKNQRNYLFVNFILIFLLFQMRELKKKVIRNAPIDCFAFFIFGLTSIYMVIFGSFLKLKKFYLGHKKWFLTFSDDRL